MPNFTLNVHCDNAAFCNEDEELAPSAELARILRHCADRIEGGEQYGHFLTIFDSNGNDVGRFALKGDQGESLTISATLERTP